ncbi:MAG: branched-chain amino acid ABC transporter permease [Planctomycetes bacterium]|nr:branched-chain amino acid ABC transporter permease [Planctomycetota bacterium]
MTKNATDQLPGPGGALLRAWWPVAAALGIALFAHLVLRPMLGDFPSKLLLDIGINIVLAVSLTMVNGFTGQFSIGHAAFMAVGGYTGAAIVYYGSYFAFGSEAVKAGVLSTLSVSHAGAPWFTSGDGLFLGSIIAGGLVAAACGYLVGLPSLRLRGDYLAIVTLGFGEIVRVLIQRTAEVSYDLDEIKAAPLVGIGQLFTQPRAEWQAPVWTRVGGALGFTGLPTYNSLFWSLAAAGLTLLVAYRIKVSSHGRALLSIREDEIASEAMGVNTTKYKIRAFVISSFFAGIAGALFAHTTGITLKASELGFVKSFDIIIMVVLGGLGSISGASIAAVILSLLPELLRKPGSLVELWPYAAGVLVLGVVLVAAGGTRPVAKRVGKALAGLGVASLVFAGAAAVAMKNGVDLSAYRMILYALALILMMILRPQGLFGVFEIWDRAAWDWLLPRRTSEPARRGVRP